MEASISSKVIGSETFLSTKPKPEGPHEGKSEFQVVSALLKVP